jgi:hypothetical protein
MIKPTRHGWIVQLSDARERAKFHDPGARMARHPLPQTNVLHALQCE